MCVRLNVLQTARETFVVLFFTNLLNSKKSPAQVDPVSTDLP